jgi:hypothetical protein
MKQATEQFPLLPEFVAFITERWNIHLRRASGAPPPWTACPVLLKYKFTNVRREDDRVTRWLHENWLRPHAGDHDLWLAMYVARVFNRVSTLKAVGYPMPWGRRKAAVLKAANALKAEGAKVFGAGYMIHSQRVAGPYRPKINYYGEIFTACWDHRLRVRPRAGNTIQEFYDRLMGEHGFGAFMAAQVCADVKHAEPLKSAVDWTTFAASGPGSRRGLMRLQGLPVEQGKSVYPGTEEEWKATLLELRKVVLPLLPKALRKLDAQNLQNVLCEMDKKCRVPEGRRPKQLFQQSSDPYV